MSSNPLSRGDFAGMAAIKKAQNANLVTMFTGTKLTFGASSVLAALHDLGNQGKTVGSLIKNSGNAATKAAMPNPGQVLHNGEKLLSACTGIHNIQTLKDVLGSDVVHKMIAEVTPLIGVFSSGYSACKSWYSVMQDVHTLYKFEDYCGTIQAGDPMAAAQALKILIERNLARDGVDAARNTAAFGAKIGGLFADFGTGTNTAIGLANSAATIAITLCSIGMDVKQMLNGNEILANPASLDRGVFKTCPLLGCYLIACSNTSDIINFAVAEMGTPGWMDRVEKMKKVGFDDLVNLAKEEIKTSRLTLDGLKSDKGTKSEMGYIDRKIMENPTLRGAKQKVDEIKSGVSKAKDLVVANAKQKFNDLVLSKIKG